MQLNVWSHYESLHLPVYLSHHHPTCSLLRALTLILICRAPEADIRRNLRLAVKHLKRAAEAGYANAHSNLAAIYLSPSADSAAPDDGQSGSADAGAAAATDGDSKRTGLNGTTSSEDGNDDDVDSSVPYNASAARYHLEQAIAAGDFPPAHFNLAIIDYHGLDAANQDDHHDDAAAAAAGNKQPKQGQSERSRRGGDHDDDEQDDLDELQFGSHRDDDDDDGHSDSDEDGEEPAAPASPPRGNCSAALKRWLGVAFRGRWLQTSPLSFQSAYHSFEASSAGESRWMSAGSAGSSIFASGLRALLPGFMRRAMPQDSGPSAPSSTSGSGEPGDDAEPSRAFAVNGAFAAFASASSALGPAPLHVAALQYLTLAAIGIPAAQDNAAFLLRGSKLLSPVETAALLDAPAVLSQPLNDTLPFAVAAHLYRYNGAGKIGGAASASAAVIAKHASSGGRSLSLVGFLFPSPSASSASTAPAATGSGATADANIRTVAADPMSQLKIADAGAMSALPQIVADSLAFQLARLSARAGSAFAPKLVGDCFTEGWEGVPECTAAAIAAQQMGFAVAPAPPGSESATQDAAEPSPSRETIAADSAHKADGASSPDSTSSTHPALVWYERAAAAGLGHAAFRLAELSAGLAHPAAAGSSATGGVVGVGVERNVTGAWEALYRVGAVDWLGDWPVSITRLRLVVSWLFDQAAALVSGGAAEAAAAAARLQDVVADLAGCALSWPPPLPDVDEDGHVDGTDDELHDDEADGSEISSSTQPEGDDHGREGDEDVGEADSAATAAAKRRAGAGAGKSRKSGSGASASPGSYTPRSGLSAAVREAAEAVAAEQQELRGKTGDVAGDATSSSSGTSNDSSGSDAALAAADPVRKAMEEALAHRTRLLQQERYPIGPWPLDWESRWTCSLFAHSLVLGVWTSGLLLAAGVAGIAASALLVR